jgi:hypothetical protein
MVTGAPCPTSTRIPSPPTQGRTWQMKHFRCCWGVMDIAIRTWYVYAFFHGSWMRLILLLSRMNATCLSCTLSHMMMTISSPQSAPLQPGPCTPIITPSHHLRTSHSHLPLATTRPKLRPTPEHHRVLTSREQQQSVPSKTYSLKDL